MPPASQPEAQVQVAQSSAPVAAAQPTTGGGASSAMARLISQEQARIVPGAVDQSANDPL